MTINTRARAALTVQQVLEGVSLNEALHRQVENLNDKDKSLLSELAYGVCRQYFQLEVVLDRFMKQRLRGSRRLVESVVRVGLYQLLYTRVPVHAAVNTSVEAARDLGHAWAVKLVNALLRRCLREQEVLHVEIEQDECAHYGLPRWLLKLLQQDWPQQWQIICQGLRQRPPMTLRVNRLRTSLADYIQLLHRKGLQAYAIEGFPDALQLTQPAAVETLPGFGEGLVSVQDAGAQHAANLLDAQPGERVLDACAAPGGKTCHLLEHQPELASLTALDLNAKRLQDLRSNLARLELKAELQTADATLSEGDWYRQEYDRILLDVPCSATGVIRRHPDIPLLRRESDIFRFVNRQAKLLANCWRRLKPGGQLLYATCSLLAVENTSQISHFTQQYASAELLQSEQFLPHSLASDGFYYALLAKHR